MLQPGSSVLVVQCHDGNTLAYKAQVVQTEPFVVEVTPLDPRFSAYQGELVSVIHSASDKQVHAVATVADVACPSGRWHLQLLPGEWAELDRRRSTRYTVSLAASLSSVAEAGSGAEIRTADACIENLSSTGCFLSAEMPLSRGDLISLTVQDPCSEDSYRMLGLVARTVEPSGYGMEFFDFSGNARAWLTRYLEQVMKQGEAA